MADTVSTLEQRLERLLERFETAKAENRRLTRDNEQLRVELGRLQKECDQEKLGSRDQRQAVRGRLESVLNRISELENALS